MQFFVSEVANIAMILFISTASGLISSILFGTIFRRQRKEIIFDIGQLSLLLGYFQSDLRRSLDFEVNPGEGLTRYENSYWQNICSIRNLRIEKSISTAKLDRPA